MKKLAELLKTARKSAGMTQADLARKLGFKNKASISAIEKAVRAIPQNKRRDYLLAVGLKMREVKNPIKEDLWNGWIGK